MKTARGMTLIVNGQLVDGTGAPPVPDAAVVVKDGKIAYAGPTRGDRLFQVNGESYPANTTP